jgi:2-C-methyl-D-erythritol 2,4-cyclodiphosphate synthase
LAEPASFRVGTGFDAHRLVPGRPLVLGGVRIPFPVGLEGHSDGDVLAHAIADALLGAVRAGDLGAHFPSSDPKTRGISSLAILEEVAALLAGRGGAIENVDAVLILEAPRVAPHTGAMRAAIAGALGISDERVSVKASSTDRLGFTGRSEGIAAQAVALVRVPG